MSLFDFATAYDLLFGKRFDNKNFVMRKNMQKTVYLLQEMGIPVGCYSFMWYKYGPFSHTLADEIKYLDLNSFSSLSLNDDSKAAVLILKELFNTQTSYPQDKWIECIGSIHFLLKYVLPKKEQYRVIQELQQRKPYLDDEQVNDLALSKVKDVIIGEC